MAAAPVNPQPHTEADAALLWAASVHLTCDLRIDLQVAEFTVRDLLQLEPGSLVASTCKQGRNVPLEVNGLLLARAAFEVLGDQLSIRLMELV